MQKKYAKMFSHNKHSKEESMKEKVFYKSKKFWTLVAGIGAAVSTYFGVDEAIVIKVVGLASAYMIGQGVADSGKK